MEKILVEGRTATSEKLQRQLTEKPRILGQNFKRKIDCAHCASGESTECNCDAFCGNPICSWRIIPTRHAVRGDAAVQDAGVLGGAQAPAARVFSGPEAPAPPLAPISVTKEEAAYYVSLMPVEHVKNSSPKKTARPSLKVRDGEETTVSVRILEDWRKTRADSELPGFPEGWTLGRDPWPYDTGKKRRGDV